MKYLNKTNLSTLILTKVYIEFRAYILKAGKTLQINILNESLSISFNILINLLANPGCSLDLTSPASKQRPDGALHSMLEAVCGKRSFNPDTEWRVVLRRPEVKDRSLFASHIFEP
jgi:hypothetical protein